MNCFPDFSDHGYEAVQELGYNGWGGRITYLATNTKTGQLTVIKQFQFARSNANWFAFEAYEHEIQVLKGLNHPRIPRYIESFETLDGFCMVQEYKHAQSLAVARSFSPDEVKQIAVSILEILVYLQHRVPSVIHRDIKPENILVEEDGDDVSAPTVYLVDFGFARIGSGEIALSSVAMGTSGFMPPEQLLNLQLTEASDLYGVGATLICLLTGIKSAKIGRLIDSSYRINFRHQSLKLSLRFIEWLEKMVNPNLNERYPDAEAALEALKPLYVIRIPEVKFSQPKLVLTATGLGEKLTGTVTVANPIPETLLQGRWEVAPHPKDPPHSPDFHVWISVKPGQFSSNQIECKFIIDTSKLTADQTYERQILLHTNSSPETHRLTLQVQTAPVPTVAQPMPYRFLTGVLMVACLVSGSSLALTMAWPPLLQGIVIAEGFGVGFIPLAFSEIFIPRPKGVSRDETEVGTLLGAVLGATLLGVWLIAGISLKVGVAGVLVGVLIMTLAGALIGSTFGFIAGAGVGFVAKNLVQKGFTTRFSRRISLLAIASGLSLGIDLALGFSNPFVMSALAGTSVPLTAMLLYPALHRRRAIAQYRQSEQRLIQP